MLPVMDIVPGNRITAQKLQDESWCTSYAHKIRWPHGFTCPTCGFHQNDPSSGEHDVCRFCRRPKSITAATLLHGTKKKLCLWLQAAWWASGRRSSLSIKELQRYLAINSYQTAWSFVNKLRRAIRLMNQKKCSGVVLIDSGVLEISGESIPALAAVESIAAGRTTGWLKMQICQSLDPSIIQGFCEQVVDPGSFIDAPCREPFVSVCLQHCLYTSAGPSPSHNTVQQICSSYRSWYRQQKYRLCHFKTYQDALEEFCFFYNAKLFSSRSHHFEALVSALLTPLGKDRGYRSVKDKTRGEQ